jgi:predicted house-cleaning NTP pyrophosphatase (Maf/HAM1 superfamily)
MGMLVDAAGGVGIHYKDARTLPLLRKMSGQWWRRAKTRRAARAAQIEVETLRERLSMATIECSEWRYKVGGAMYESRGFEFMEIVEGGIKNRIGKYIQITDEDLFPGK